MKIIPIRKQIVYWVNEGALGVNNGRVNTCAKVSASLATAHGNGNGI